MINRFCPLFSGFISFFSLKILLLFSPAHRNQHLITCFARVLSIQSFYFDKFSQLNHFLKTPKNLSRHHFNANSFDFLDKRNKFLKMWKEEVVVFPSYLSSLSPLEMSSILNLLTEKQQSYHPRYERKTPKKIKTSQQSQFFYLN